MRTTAAHRTLSSASAARAPDQRSRLCSSRRSAPLGGVVFTKRVEVEVSRPPDEVFAFVADARNRPLWDESVDTEELTSPEPIGVGSTVRTRMRSMGRDYVLTWEIVEHEPPSRQTIESTAGPFGTTLAYRLSAQDGGTLVEFRSQDVRPECSVCPSR